MQLTQKFIFLFLVLALAQTIFLSVATADIKNESALIRTATDYNNGIFGNGYSVKDVNIVLKGFVTSFEKGDINQFVNLFADDVKTEEGKNKADLRADYEELFDGSFKRKIRFKDASWREKNDGTIWGDVDFVLNIGNRIDGQIKHYSGSMRFYFKKSAKHLIITALFHVYDK